MIDTYTIWKTLHILSAAILFGTGLGIAFFAWFGYRRALKVGEIDGLRAVLRLTIIADTCFTAPAVVVQFVSGLVMMHMAAWSLSSPWGLAALGLFTLVGVFWFPVVAIQILLSREAHQANTIAELSKSFHRRFTVWFALGIPAFLVIIVIFYLMVAKPLPMVTS